ncbi:hypothetical protein fugu_004332 [Takifugu bimaculatus]|uniref:Annexin n=1 Tax=Takifugu bimaculatus TaxID=433685 RepID=A0A4Z2BEG3_9TELE|nr:hypothetical protein fugu_004332 [Takifugu bimaculatus]
MASLLTGERGTIKPKANFDAKEDAVALRKALEGLGTKEKVLIEILTTRSSSQRQLICAAYQEATSRTLLEDIKGDTHGSFEALLVALITPPALFDCHEVMRAMKSEFTFLHASATEKEKKLTSDLKKELSGDFSKALLLLAEGKREESTAVDQGKAKEDAKTLYNAGEKKWGTDEKKFIDILCNRSIAQLKQTLVEYTSISGKSLQQSIESEMSGELERLLLAIVKCVNSVPAFFAELLYKSMKGCGTDESTLTRIMSELGGDYRGCVMAICGGDD